MISNPKSDKANPDCNDAACGGIEFYCADGYVPESGVGYLIKRVLMAVGQEIERQLEPSGLTNAQWVPLFKLHIGKTATVAELARGCHMDAGAMTRLLDRLETKGLCRRVRSLDDRRVVNIELTDAGVEAAKGIPAVLCRVQNAHLAGFSEAEFETLKGFLNRILDNAHTQSQTPLNPGGPHEA
ncbi:MAG: MarR family transcriptional regulator [Rhodoferax sp.]|uniref:MarR family winged helix-turn-helix transcriptional regulator n=1 Tax=Rhodoferax sp. TaxID=50421 RepID=UPI0030195473